MRADTILALLPQADPDFIRILASLPDPPPGAFEQVAKAIPELHRLFLHKREAARNNQTELFLETVEAEVALLQKLEKMSKTA